MTRVAALILASSLALGTPAQSPITAPQVLSAPFMNQLTAAPAKNRVAWFVDQEGIRNIWVASPTERANAITHYTRDDGQDIEGITWSPDGERVAYTRGTGPDGSEHPTAANPAHLQEDVKQRIELATVTGDVRVIGEGRASVFSTDGKHLFYLSHGKVISADLTDATSKPVELIVAKGTATQLRPSPDGLKLAFVSKRGDHSFIGVFTLGPPNASQGRLTYVDPGTGLDHDPVWSPDSQRIAFIRESPIETEVDLRWMRSVPVPWSIRIANVATGEGTEVWHADKGTGSLFHEVVAKNQLLWMADNRIVFPWEKTGWLNLYSLTPGDPTAKPLTPGDFEVDEVTTDGERIVYSSNQAGSDKNDIDRKHLWSVSSTTNKPLALTQGAGIETNPALLSNGTVTAMQGGVSSPFVPKQFGSTINPQTPIPFIPEDDFSLNYCITNGQKVYCGSRVFDSLSEASGYRPSPVASSQFVTPQQVIFPATDGLPIHGQLFLPKNIKPGTKLPTIVFFHGGSRRQMLLGYNPMQYYAQAYEFNQLLVAHGYAVLSVNYRSGTGYGMEFRQATHYGMFGGTEYLDVEGAVKYLKSRPDIDTKHMGAWGGSYGGYLTALALARDSADFAAGVDLHGVHDWAYEMDLSKPSDDPAHNQAEAIHVAYAASPMADIAKWTSPVLLMQGDDDRNVLFGQTVRLAAALRAKGVPVEEKIFPDEVHDFLLHKNWVTAYALALDYFNRQLKPR